MDQFSRLRIRIESAKLETSTRTFQATVYWLDQWRSIALDLEKLLSFVLANNGSLPVDEPLSSSEREHYEKIALDLVVSDNAQEQRLGMALQRALGAYDALERQATKPQPGPRDRIETKGAQE